MAKGKNVFVSDWECKRKFVTFVTSFLFFFPLAKKKKKKKKKTCLTLLCLFAITNSHRDKKRRMMNFNNAWWREGSIFWVNKKFYVMYLIDKTELQTITDIWNYTWEVFVFRMTPSIWFDKWLIERTSNNQQECTPPGWRQAGYVSHSVLCAEVSELAPGWLSQAVPGCQSEATSNIPTRFSW